MPEQQRKVRTVVSVLKSPDNSIAGHLNWGTFTLRRRVEAAGHGARLVQTFVHSGEYSYLGDAICPPLFEALLAWVERGTKPTLAGNAEHCCALRAAAPGECRFVVDYAARPLASRVAPR
jgi:hypothetical protein